MSNTTIKASPTKEFFINMLTRDVLLTRAIIDLVDNSVDGAKRLRPDGNFTGLSVSIHFSNSEFRIEDNCGGIPVDIARNYAFCFGRPKDAPNTNKSVGQFGVGMKRTFFKLGRFFEVTSTTTISRFDMAVDVDEWLNQEDETDLWHFNFRNVEEGLTIPLSETGTKILVNRLLDEGRSAFSLNSFVKELQSSLTESHSLVLGAGLQICVNGVYLTSYPLEMLESDQISPAYIEKAFYEDDPKPAKVRMYAGVSSRQKDDGGWYIFCNGRMVVRADQTMLSGWGEGEGKIMPKYHPDFAFFRGYVFFDCEDSSKLPWTTTKTGVDADSWLFRTVREDMIQIAKPVLRFLRDLASERAEVAAGDRNFSPLEQNVSSGAPTALTSFSQRATFTGPARQVVTGPRMQKIQYTRPLDEVNEVKAHLGVRTFTDVGLRTFDYYKEYEMGS
jgi:hypothetical protein